MIKQISMFRILRNALMFASVGALLIMVSCNSNNSDGAGAKTAEASAEMLSYSLGKHAVELFGQISDAIEEGQSILEYGHYVIELQKEFKNVLDTCSNIDDRFPIRRLATDISNDVRFITIGDSIQSAYYADSIAELYNQITYHWRKGSFKEGLMFFTEAYEDMDSVSWVFPMSIFIPKDKSKEEFMVVEFPDDAVGDTYLFIIDSKDAENFVWSLGPDDAFVQVMEKGNEIYGHMAILFPLDSIMPHIRENETIGLSYLTDGASGIKRRSALFHMKEFLKLYDALD